MNEKDNIRKYEDIINLPHHQSKTRPHMPLRDRAAQFSPFQALTGYGEAVNEAARLTDRKEELPSDVMEELNRKLTLLQQNRKECPKITITYFVPDEKKEGGAYVTEEVQVRSVDEYERVIVLTDQKKIPIENIRDMSGEWFAGFGMIL